MNQDLNNLNQNDFNALDNNRVSNNQPSNNQNFNQDMEVNFQSISQQTIMQTPTQQVANTFESCNNNKNLNSKSPKKTIYIGLIIGIVVAVAVTLIIFLLSIINKNDNGVNDNLIDEQYLDITRNLKSEYEYKEIFDSYAVKLNEKTTYIIKTNKNYLVDILQFSQGFVSKISGFYKIDNGTVGAYFDIITLNESTLDEVKNNIISSGYYDIIDENSNYILSSDGQDYLYNTIIDETIIEVQLSSSDDYFNKFGLSKDDIIDIIKNIKTIIKEDDLKEPYLVDKIINVKLSDNYKIKTYLMIVSVINDIQYGESYSIDLYNDEENGDYAILDIIYDTKKIINNYNLTNKVNDNPKVYYDKNEKSFIFGENNNKQIFKIRKYNIDGNAFDINTYQDFTKNIKFFLNKTNN